METWLAAVLVRYRGWFVLLSLLVTAAIASGASRLWFDSDYRLFFKPDNPQLLAHERIQNEFTRSDNISFIVAPQSGDLFTRENLAALEWLTAEAWKVPRSIRVDSITNFQHTAADGDELRVSDLIQDAASMTDAEVAERRATALAQPMVVNLLLAPDARATAVNVRLELPPRQDAPDTATPEIMAHARDLKQRFESRYPQFKVHLMGLIAVDVAFNELSQRDSLTLVPIMFAIVVVLLVAFLRSWSGAFATVCVIAGSLAIAVGFMGWVGYHGNQVNVSSPTIVLTLAISESVHILLTYLQGLGRGLTRPGAMEESLRVNLAPVFFTNVTTAFGFIGLNFSESPPFREMGNIAAFGVMGTGFLAFALLPGLMMWLPVKIKPGMGQEAHWPVVDRICEFALAQRRRLFWITLAVVAFTASFIARNNLNDDTVEYFGKGTEMREAFDFVQQHLTGIDSIAYRLDSGAANGIADPAFLKKVEAFAEWYRGQPQVAHVSVFTEVIKRLNRTMNGDDPAYYRLPDDPALISQYILLYELSLPQGLDVNDQVSFDKSALRMNVSIRNLKSRELIELEGRAQAWLAANAPEMASPGSSVPVMFAHLGQSNIDSMMEGAFVSIVLISLAMILSLRSFKFGLVSIVPNLLPAAMAFGLWGMFVGEVNLAVAAVFNVSSGIVIDDTIHFLSKYLRGRRHDGLSPADAVRYSYATTGSALFVNTAVLVLGFLVLTVSDFTVNSSLGLMTALCIGVALLFDLLFLPALLLRVDRTTPQ